MTDLAAKGGSYKRQADGSLKLETRTEEAKPETAAPATTKPAKPAKEVSNG